MDEINKLPRTTDAELEMLIDHCFQKRLQSPWYQMVESALRELQERRASDSAGQENGSDLKWDTPDLSKIEWHRHAEGGK